MIKLRLNDRYIKSKVAFESYEDGTARMSYFGEPKLPLGSVYEIDGDSWKVVRVQKSSFNSQVVNVDMVLNP